MVTLRINRVDKHYGAVHAVKSVSVEFEAGQIHAVLGENGAGRSTLLKMAAGIVKPESGTIETDGKRLEPVTAAAAHARGVAMVTQHFALVPVFSALENVQLGAERVRGPLGVLDREGARQKAMAVAEELGLALDWDVPVATLGVGDRQRLEIMRALYREARIIILDEPTAVLTPAEADALYGVLRRLADGGRTIIVVTHKLDDIRKHVDRVTVMRKGERVLRGLGG